MTPDDFDFDLPERLIATRPARPRSAARLLVAEGDRLRDAHVFDLPQILRPGDRLILNNTKVLPARFSATRDRDTAQGPARAKVEVTLLAPQADGAWSALLKPLRKVRDGERLVAAADLSCRVERRSEGEAILRFDQSDETVLAWLDKMGTMPLPPYIAGRRAADAADRTDYQTIWAERPGAVAAPTASLHFDDALMAEMAQAGIAVTYVTLHVGAGTFLPVKVEDITRHRMHAEWGEITEAAAAEIRETRAAGGRIIPVGTTALRLIETAARASGEIAAWRGETDIFIYPGYQMKITDGLMTNFHLPKSTLMMLVSALMGRDRIMALYAHAIAQDYRFFSYGDASLLFPSQA